MREATVGSLWFCSIYFLFTFDLETTGRGVQLLSVTTCLHPLRVVGQIEPADPNEIINDTILLLSL